MQWIPNDENKRRDEAFADFIGGVAYEEDRGWSKEVWDAAWSARREWVGLTGPEVDEAYCSVGDKEWAIGGLADARVFFCAIEAKLREKNG